MKAKKSRKHYSIINNFFSTILQAIVVSWHPHPKCLQLLLKVLSQKTYLAKVWVQVHYTITEFFHILCKELIWIGYSVVQISHFVVCISSETKQLLSGRKKKNHYLASEITRTPLLHTTEMLSRANIKLLYWINKKLVLLLTKSTLNDAGLFRHLGSRMSELKLRLILCCYWT